MSVSAESLLRSNVVGLSDRQLAKARELEKEGLCNVTKQEYVKCARYEDPDYDDTIDKSCSGVIFLDEEEEPLTCPHCHRPIRVNGKKRFEEYSCEIIEEGVYRAFSRRLKKVAGRSKSKKNSGLSFLDKRIEHAFNLGLSDGDLDVLLLFNSVHNRVLDMIKIYDDNFLLILVDDALILEDKLQDLNIDYLTPEQVMSNGEQILNEVNAAKLRGPHSDREFRARLSYRACSDPDTLSEMQWDDFEQCVNALLQGIFSTSLLLGGKESGDEVPDGVLTLNFADEHLYIWDSKFVRSGSETELSSEYDKMNKHLRDFRNESNAKDKFGGVAGFIIFSQKVKTSHVVNLAEKISSSPENEDWPGTVIHFSLDSLLALFTKYLQENEGDVQEKEINFRKFMHRYLTQPHLHDTEPEEFEETGASVIDISEEDIENLFSQISRLDTERESPDIEGYLVSLRMITD